MDGRRKGGPTVVIVVVVVVLLTVVVVLVPPVGAAGGLAWVGVTLMVVLPVAVGGTAVVTVIVVFALCTSRKDWAYKTTEMRQIMHSVFSSISAPSMSRPAMLWFCVG